MPEDLRTPITEVLLKEGDYLVLVYPTQTLKAFDVYGFKVMRAYPLHRVYDKFNAIDAGGSLNFGFLGTTGFSSGDDILEIWEERPLRIYHFAIGVHPDFIWLYKAQPAGTPQGAFAYKTPPKVGSEYDYIPGHLSPLDEPTVATETVLHYKMSLNIGFYNPSDEVARPVIRILGKAYDTFLITDPNLIYAILRGEYPETSRVITVGGLATFTYAVPEEWGAPLTIKAEEVTKIAGGGK